MWLPHWLQGQKVKSQGGAGAYCGGDLAAQLVIITLKVKGVMQMSRLADVYHNTFAKLLDVCKSIHLHPCFLLNYNNNNNKYRHIRFWYLWCCGCPGLRGRQHLANNLQFTPWGLWVYLMFGLSKRLIQKVKWCKVCGLQEKVDDSVRISKLRLFAEYLCGIDPPLMSYDVERSCYVSAITPLSSAADDEKDQRDVTRLSDTEAKV